MEFDEVRPTTQAVVGNLYFDSSLPDTIVFWEAVSSAYATHQVVDGVHIIRVNPALAGWQSVARFAP
jgi:hypothetical protein